MKRVQIKDISSVVSKGTTPTTHGHSYQEDGIPLLRVNNIDSGKFNLEDVKYIDEKAHNDLKRSQLQKNDLIISIAGSIGKTAIVEESILPANCNQALAFVRLDDEKIDLRFVQYWLNSQDAIGQITKNKVTATISNLSLTQIKNLKIPLPTLSEQKAIVAKLDRAQRLIDIDREMLAKYDELIQSVFLEMFGDPVTNPKGWEVKKLKNISTAIFNGTTPKGGKKVYVEEGILFLRSQNVWRNRLDLEDVAYIDKETHESMSRSSLKKGDILMTKTGRFNTENSSLGRAAMFRGEDDSANLNGHVYLIRLKKKVINDFVLYILTTDMYREYIRRVCVGGIDKRQINKSHLHKFPIIMPPDELQLGFKEKLNKIEQEKAKIKVQLSKSEELFSSLMQGAFSE